MASQRDSCWKLILDIISKWQLTEYCLINKSNFEITFPNDSQILFKGIDDPEKIKSIVGVTDCWCEESTELTEEDFSQLILRLRTKDAKTQFFLSFNPCSKASWVYKYYFAPEANVDEDTTLILKTTYLDNNFLPADYVESLKALIKTNPTYYKIYALGEFCSLDKLVYNNWKAEDFDIKAVKGTLVAGLDFGYVADPTAFIVSVVDEESKVIHVIQEWVETGKTNTEIAKAITALGHSKTNIIADSAEPKSVEELRRLGVYRIRESTKGKDSIIHGIQKLQQYRIIIHNSCDNLITELQNYSWKKDRQTNEYTNEPIDNFNHCLDALRYSIQSINKNHLSSISKAALGL